MLRNIIISKLSKLEVLLKKLLMHKQKILNAIFNQLLNSGLLMAVLKR